MRTSIEFTLNLKNIDCVEITNRTGDLAGPDPGFSVGGEEGFGLQCGHFSVKMYAKTKESGPVGGVRRHAPPPQIRLCLV